MQISKFDRILKDSFEKVFLQSSQSWLGIDLVNATIKALPLKLSRSTDREVDFLKRVTLQNNETLILHIEFQTRDDPDMIYRMAEYKAMLQRKYQTTTKQFVIYLGQHESKMKTKLAVQQQIKGFELIQVHQLKPENLLKSVSAQEII